MEPTNAIYVFIDSSNLWQAQKAKGKLLDFEKIIACVKNKFGGGAVQGYYYTAYPVDGSRDYSLDGKHKFYTYLKKGLKFIVRKKPLKRIIVDSEEGQSIQEKGNMDVEMTIDIVHTADRYDTAVLFTGDSDFLAVVRYLRARGIKVFIISSKNNVSHELRTGGDGYYDLLDMPDEIWGKEIVRRTK